MKKHTIRLLIFLMLISIPYMRAEDEVSVEKSEIYAIGAKLDKYISRWLDSDVSKLTNKQFCQVFIKRLNLKGLNRSEFYKTLRTSIPNEPNELVFHLKERDNSMTISLASSPEDLVYDTIFFRFDADSVFLELVGTRTIIEKSDNRSEEKR